MAWSDWCWELSVDVNYFSLALTPLASSDAESPIDPYPIAGLGLGSGTAVKGATF